ncbi:MAG: phosphoenolpyruvate--protein phosphotransferase, partial [Candidatus Zixiibacteriota bacterium]
PGDVLTLRNRKVSGLIAEEGGRNSHAALIARSLLVPMVVLPNATRLLHSGERIIIDGNTGVVIVNPDDREWADYQKQRRRQGPALISRIKRLPKIPPVTADGVEITVAANLEMPGPADQILADRKLPVGLYRTEFLFLQNDRFPDEETQYEYYERIAEQYADSHVILRVFDLGADKAMNHNGVSSEENPALGWRGIRMLLGMPDVFATQIRAILRASHRGNLKILLPMVSDLDELNKAHKLIGQVKLELDRKRVPYDKAIEIGVMIEVPAAALMAEQLAKRADFVSIGTNDLAQYTMSADRSNNRVADLYSARHPSVLKLIRMTVEAGLKAGKLVSICGEAAGDTLSLPLFVGMGVRYLSMNPVRIVEAARLIGKLNAEVVAHLVRGVMSATTVNEVTRRLESFRATLPK